MANPVTDVGAELAVIHGFRRPLADYFRTVERPSNDVMISLSRCLQLEGPDGQQLRFKVRTGKPPKVAVQEQNDGLEAIKAGSAAALFNWLLGQDYDAPTRLALADALDPRGACKWQLVFSRANRGNRSPETDIREIAIGLEALCIEKRLNNKNGGARVTVEAIFAEYASLPRVKGDHFTLDIQRFRRAKSLVEKINKYWKRKPLD